MIFGGAFPPLDEAFLKWLAEVHETRRLTLILEPTRKEIQSLPETEHPRDLE